MIKKKCGQGYWPCIAFLICRRIFPEILLGIYLKNSSGVPQRVNSHKIIFELVQGFLQEFQKIFQGFQKKNHSKIASEKSTSTIPSEIVERFFFSIFDGTPPGLPKQFLEVFHQRFIKTSVLADISLQLLVGLHLEIQA